MLFGPRQYQPRLESALRMIAQRYLTTHGLRDIAGYRETQSGPTRPRIARPLQTVERLEHALELVLGDTRAAIAYHQRQCLGAIRDRKLHVAPVTQSVVQQVLDAALQPLRLADERRDRLTG